MFTLEAPYRLETVSDIWEYLRLFPEHHSKEWVVFARKNVLEKPPILAKIPDRIDFEIFSFNSELAKEVNSPELTNDDFSLTELEDVVERLRFLVRTVAADAPQAMWQFGTQAIVDGTKLLAGRKLKESINHGAHDRMAMVAWMIELPDLIGQLFYQYLNRGGEKLEKWLYSTLLLSRLYTNQELDRQKIDKILKLPVHDPLLLKLLYDLMVVDLITYRDHKFYRPFLSVFLESEVGRLQKIRGKQTDTPEERRILTNLVTNLGAILLGTLAGDCRYVSNALQGARGVIEHQIEMRQGKIPEIKLQQVESIVWNNLFPKIDKFEDFFDRFFLVRKLKQIKDGLIDDVPMLHEDGWDYISIFHDIKLIMYPCKDYLDWRKGWASQDCTTQDPSTHLLNQRFFNIRLFVDKVDFDFNSPWIGNVYCLDFTDIHGAVVIDRIQIARTTSFMPIGFLPRFINSLTTLFPKGVALLGPRCISNFEPINNSYRHFCKNMETIELSLEGIEGFSCAEVGEFHVLRNIQPN